MIKESKTFLTELIRFHLEECNEKLDYQVGDYVAAKIESWEGADDCGEYVHVRVSFVNGLVKVYIFEVLRTKNQLHFNYKRCRTVTKQ